MDHVVIRRRIQETKQVALTIEEYDQIVSKVALLRETKTVLPSDSMQFLIETVREVEVYDEDEDEDEG